MKSMRHGLNVVAAALIAAGICASARADVKLPAIFSNGMVLQRESAVPVWGWAAPFQATCK